MLGSVVAPATLLTALLLYFGRMHATGFFRYLGVSYTALDLTPADYLVRSADGMIPPLAVSGGLILLGLWTHQLVAARLPSPTRTALSRVLVPICALLGLATGGLAAADTVTAGAVFPTVPELRGLSLCAGVLLLLAAAGMARSRSRAARDDRVSVEGPGVVVEWAVAFLLVGVGLFWAVGSYASGVGTGRGIQLESALAGQADTTVFSTRSLGITGRGVLRTTCRETNAAFSFRYTGLKLVLQSGGQYLLAPAGWTRGTGAVLLLPRDGSVRLEFGAPGTPVAPGC